VEWAASQHFTRRRQLEKKSATAGEADVFVGGSGLEV